MPRTFAILEPMLVFTLIMTYIWKLRFVNGNLWMVILAVMLLSHALRRETPAKLGFGLHNLRGCVHELAPALTLLALVLLAGGILLRTTRQIGFDRELVALALYVPWGVAQQYALNGYFLNRLDGLLSRRAAPAVTAALFSCAHTPNWFLMVVTLLLGYCATLVYRRYRNLYFLGMAHAAVGFLLFLVVPDSISHHLIVGPGWFRR
ncbi:MAG TPA: CPBP family intramembrane glutamic endopeptidase [Bryobacteraceae bacterium]|nr:CPBP family intramembrane glutamic endopeptidase [Bryobacteraceae bacterium]